MTQNKHNNYVHEKRKKHIKIALKMLSTCHKFYVKNFVIEEIVHEGLKSVRFVADFLKIIESGQDDFMAAFH